MRSAELRHFYRDSDATISEVRQDEDMVAEDADELFTEGLGPCICVAFAWQRKGYMIHVPGLSHHGAFDDFIERVCDLLPQDALHLIRPLLAGGLDDDIDGCDVLSDRNHCLDRLRVAGFGEPFQHWCSVDHYQAVYLDVVGNRARVLNEPMGFEGSRGAWAVEVALDSGS